MKKLLWINKIIDKIYCKPKSSIIKPIENGIYKNLKTGDYWNWYSDSTNLKMSKEWQDKVMVASGKKYSTYVMIFGNYTLVSYDDELNKVKIERLNKLKKINERR